MFPNDDDLISRLFEGHDDLLADVRHDFSARLGEAEMPQGEFLHPDTNPTLQPLMTNAKARWSKNRPSVLSALQRIGPTVCGDEASSILKRFNFRCMEDFTSKSGRRLSSSAKGSGLQWPAQVECSAPTASQKRVQRRKTEADLSTPEGLLRAAESFLEDSPYRMNVGAQRDLLRLRGGTYDDRHMEDEKPGCVCDQCGRTVTHREYSSGSTTCCKNGSVVPEEDFGKTYEARRKRPVRPYSGPVAAGRGDCVGCGADKRTTYIDPDTQMCQDCVGDTMKDYHSQGMHTEPDERCPSCRNQQARGTTSIFGQSGPGSGFSTFPEDCGKTKRHKDGRTYDNKEDMVEALIDQFESTGVVVVQEDAGDPINSTYAVHMDRSVVAPGSSYTNWHSQGHLHKIHNWLDQAGLGHDKDRLTSYGYEDVSLEYPSKETAHQAAHKLDAVLPRASDSYHKDWLGGKGHHVMVGHMSGTEDEIPMFHGYTYPSHMEESTRGMTIEARDKSCWGCGNDWQNRWHPDDLAKMKASSKYGSSWMCPDCVGEEKPSELDFGPSGRKGARGVKDVSIPVHELDPEGYHACGNCGFAGKRSSATNCPECKHGKLQVVKPGQKHPYSESFRERAGSPAGHDDNKCDLCGSELVRNGICDNDECPCNQDGFVDTDATAQTFRGNRGKVGGNLRHQRESVAPGYLPRPHASNNASRPDGHHAQGTPSSASEALQDLHRRLGSALPELHALAVSTITDERAALGMLFNELHTAHCDLGNVLSYHNQIPDLEMSEMVQHYSKVVSEMLGALNPYLTKNPAVGTGPYHLGGPLHDSEELPIGDVLSHHRWIADMNTMPHSGHEFFDHPNHPDDRVKVNKDGTWNHHHISGQVFGKGRGGNSLHAHLQTRYQDESFSGGVREALHSAQAMLGPFEDVSDMLVKYRDFVTRATRGAGKTESGMRAVKKLQELCTALVEDQSWYQPRRAGAADTDWSYGKGKPMAAGQSVKVNLAGHPFHGQAGKIVRQQSNQFAVEFPHRPGKVEFFGANQLENA